MKNMSEINMHQNFLNKDKFIQKPLKMCKVFKVKPLNAPKLDVPSRNTAYNLFCKHMQKVKKKSQGGRVSKASAIISEEWKRVKASDKKMKSTGSFMKKRNNDMRRSCRDIKKMKWRSLTPTKKARPKRQAHSLMKHQGPPKSLKKHQDQAMEKRQQEKNPARQPKKAPKPPEFIEADDSNNDKQKPKQPSRPGN